MMAAYLDESGTHDGAPMCVAGYLFTAPQARQFNKKWAKVREREGIGYFHTKDASNPSRGELKDKSPARVLALRKELIALIRERMLYGAAVVMSVDEYTGKAPPGFIAHYGNAYTACLHLCLGLLVTWVKKSSYKGRIAYFFESGHEHQNEANERFQNIARSTAAKDDWRYTSHSFVSKKEHPPCDAADFLAWQVNKYIRDSWRFPVGSPQRRAMRMDFGELLKGHMDASPARYQLLEVSGPILDAFFRSQKPPHGAAEWL